MKEGINFAQPDLKRRVPVTKLLPLNFETRTAARLATVSGLVVSLSFLFSLSLTQVENYYVRQKVSAERELATLSRAERLVISVVTQKNELEFIKKQKIDFIPYFNLVDRVLPGDATLYELAVEPKNLGLSAKTTSGLSFTKVVSNLLEAKTCQSLTLTQSLYEQRADLFDFSLVCSL